MLWKEMYVGLELIMTEDKRDELEQGVCEATEDEWNATGGNVRIVYHD